MDKNKVEISKNFVAFSEYMNFTQKKSNIVCFFFIQEPWRRFGRCYGLRRIRSFVVWRRDDLRRRRCCYLLANQYGRVRGHSITMWTRWGWRHFVDNDISWTLFFKMGDFSWTLLGDFSWTLLSTRSPFFGWIFVDIFWVNSSGHFLVVIINSARLD